MRIKQDKQEDDSIELLCFAKVRELADKIEKIFSGDGVPDSRANLLAVSEKSLDTYRKCASRFIDIDEHDIVRIETSVEEIIEKIRASQTLSTLRFYATAIRYYACYELQFYRYEFSDYLDTYNHASNDQYRLHSPENFYSVLELADLYPSDYRRDDWVAIKRKRSKIWSLKGLPGNWQESMADLAWKERIGYRIPILVALVTGLRPCELQKGVLLTKEDGKLVALIQGGKVTEYNGQPNRKLVLADHQATKYLIAYMDMQEIKYQLTVKVKSGNAVTKSMTRLGKSLWPKHKEKITLYTARHAMASDCKKVDSESGEESPLFTSAVLGHRSDRTKGTYGNCRYSSGGSGGVAPLKVEVECKIRVHNKGKDFINKKTKSKSKKPSM